jgi:hypothetical protein
LCLGREEQEGEGRTVDIAALVFSRGDNETLTRSRSRRKNIADAFAMRGRAIE